MKLYYTAASTPLKFHKFYFYVGLPLNILIGLAGTVLFIREGNFHLFSTLFAISLTLISLALHVTCFIGLFTWRSYSFYIIFIQLGLGIVSFLLAPMLPSLYAPVAPSVTVLQLICSVIINALIAVYYLKRRPLFFPHLRQDTAAASDYGKAQ